MSDRELLEICLDFWYAEGDRPAGCAEDMQTIIETVRQYYRERLLESMEKQKGGKPNSIYNTTVNQMQAVVKMKC